MHNVTHTVLIKSECTLLVSMELANNNRKDEIHICANNKQRLKLK